MTSEQEAEIRRITQECIDALYEAGHQDMAQSVMAVTHAYFMRLRIQARRLKWGETAISRIER